MIGDEVKGIKKHLEVIEKAAEAHDMAMRHGSNCITHRNCDGCRRLDLLRQAEEALDKIARKLLA